MITLDQALDTVMQLPYDQRETLLELVRKREIEQRREEIAVNICEAKEDFYAGKLKAFSANELITDLNNSQSQNDNE